MGAQREQKLLELIELVDVSVLRLCQSPLLPTQWLCSKPITEIQELYKK